MDHHIIKTSYWKYFTGHLSRDLLSGRWVGVTKVIDSRLNGTLNMKKTYDLTYMTLHSCTLQQMQQLLSMKTPSWSLEAVATATVTRYTNTRPGAMGWSAHYPKWEGNILPLTAIKVKSSIFKSCKHEAQICSCSIVRIKVKVENLSATGILQKNPLDFIFFCCGGSLSPHQSVLRERSVQEA